MNGHTIGFRPQPQKLELFYVSPLLTPGVKGLNSKDKESLFLSSLLQQFYCDYTGINIEGFLLH